MPALTRGATLANPEFSLEAYGIQNPFIQEAIRLGAWNDATCPRCQGAGVHPCHPFWHFGRAEWISERKCEHCRGRGYFPNRQDRRILAEDFAGPEDLAVAQRFFGYGWPPMDGQGQPIKRARR